MPFNITRLENNVTMFYFFVDYIRKILFNYAEWKRIMDERDCSLSTNQKRSLVLNSNFEICVCLVNLDGQTM